MSVNSNFKNLLNIFNAKRVKYLIIGGYAVIYYAELDHLLILVMSVFSEQSFFAKN